MRRRDLIALAGAAAVAWPLVVRAQPARKMRRLGVIEPGAAPDPYFDAFRDGLRELGYTEGRDLLLEVRWAEGKSDRFDEFAAELVALNVDVIKTLSTPVALAAKRATTTIPVVFVGVGDPVGVGLVPSLARPQGNVTGIANLAPELSAKRLEILREVVPNLSPVGMLWNDTNPSMALRAKEFGQAAATIGVTLQSYGVHDLVAFDPAFDAMVNARTAAIVTLADPFTSKYRKQIIDFAAERHLPAIYEVREFVTAGGLLSYGPSFPDMERRSAALIDKILKGTKPSDIPVELPTRFELVINLKTAKALGLTIPSSILGRADEVIE
jgi:putative tryptophan/tyrosine transport system substrate-binding protein